MKWSNKMQLEDLVSKHQKKLNETDWAIYNAIKKHEYNEITIQKLADNVHVSTTTVYRFCKKIGLSGFSELAAMLKYQVTQNLSVDFEDLKSYYHAIVRYIDQYNSVQLFKQIKESETIYILARSITELRVAREMVRIFMPMGKLIIILPNNQTLINQLSNLDKNILFCIDIDFTEDYPVEFKNYVHLKKTYFVLFSHLNRYAIQFDEHLLLPASGNFRFNNNSYTQYMMSIEILYLKYMLTQK